MEAGTIFACRWHAPRDEDRGGLVGYLMMDFSDKEGDNQRL
jgi:hypothetical protein